MRAIVDFGNDGFKVDVEICIDGDKWCCFASNFALMPAGFGKTIQSAIGDFKSNVRNDRPPKEKNPPTETTEYKDVILESEVWNGNGLPPVGDNCEFEYPEGKWNKGYYHGKIVSGPIKLHIVEYDGGAIETLGGLTKFRKTETTEEKEALDEKTYRYERVEFEKASDAVIAFENGDELHTHFITQGFVSVEAIQQVVPNWQANKLYRRIEVTEEELELEAAYDLYIDSKQSNEPCMSKIIFISTEGREQEFWLRIVRKTGYRKSLNDVNGKG